MNKIGDLDVIKEDKNIALYTKMIKRGLLRDHYFIRNQDKSREFHSSIAQIFWTIGLKVKNQTRVIQLTFNGSNEIITLETGKWD